MNLNCAEVLKSMGSMPQGGSRLCECNAWCRAAIWPGCAHVGLSFLGAARSEFGSEEFHDRSTSCADPWSRKAAAAVATAFARLLVGVVFPACENRLTCCFRASRGRPVPACLRKAVAALVPRCATALQTGCDMPRSSPVPRLPHPRFHLFQQSLRLGLGQVGEAEDFFPRPQD